MSIAEICNKIPFKDKGCHFIVGFFGTLILGFVIPIVWSIIIMAIIGVAKEIYDEMKSDGTGFSFMDIVATYLGIGLAFLIYVIYLSYVLNA